MKKPIIHFLIKRKLNKRFRLSAAFLFVLLIMLFLLFTLPEISPRYLFTIGDRLTLLTPHGFNLGQIYNFSTLSYDSPKTSFADKELALRRPDNHIIVFKYPEIITLGRPTYLGNEISQSVDFSVKDSPITGLIQIWALSSSLEDFLESSKNYSNLEYIEFEQENKKNNTLPYTLWNYTINKEGKTIRGLEAFFDDPPYMYRISVFLDDKEYNDKIKNLFDDLVKSVTVK